MSTKYSKSLARNGNLLGLTGLPLHFSFNCPSAWPWDMEIVDLPALHQKINIREVSLEAMLRLLVDLTDESLKDNAANNKGLPPVIALTDRETKLRPQFDRRITKLTSVDRLNCCGHCKAGVRLVDGRPLVLDPRSKGEPLFGDDPIAWIRSGLHAIDAKVLSSSESWFVPTGWFLPCPALLIEPCESPEGHRILNSTIPAIYIGTQAVNDVIKRWWATFWFRNIRDGYALAGERLQTNWRERVPGASEPDPVFRFMREPSKKLQEEALLFLRHAHGTAGDDSGQPPVPAPVDGAGTGKDQGNADSELHTAKAAKHMRGDWASDEPPTGTDWYGPIEGPLYKLARWARISVPTLKTWRQKGRLRVVLLHGKKFQVWFKSRHEYEKAKTNCAMANPQS